MWLFGLEIHLVWTLISLLIIVVVLLGTAVNYFETFLPSVLSDTIRYGKHLRPAESSSSRPIVLIQLPKSYFLHFYLFGIVYGTSLWVAVCTVYLLEIPAPSWLIAFLDFCGTSSRAPTSSAEAVLIASTLFLLQVWRRLYECAFVSLYSPAAKINLVQYSVGYLHYFCAGAGILLEAPCFTPDVDLHSNFR